MTSLLRRAWIVVALVAFLPFAQTLPNAPVLDDGWAVVENPLVQGGLRNAARILTSPYNFGGPSTTGGLFRPVTTLSFAANYAVHGRTPLGYHLVNLLLHVAASLLVLSLARRLAEATMPDRAPWVALVAGLLSAVHPAHVESVAFVSGRTDLLRHLTADRLHERYRVAAFPALPRLACSVMTVRMAATTRVEQGAMPA